MSRVLRPHAATLNRRFILLTQRTKTENWFDSIVFYMKGCQLHCDRIHFEPECEKGRGKTFPKYTALLRRIFDAMKIVDSFAQRIVCHRFWFTSSKPEFSHSFAFICVSSGTFPNKLVINTVILMYWMVEWPTAHIMFGSRARQIKHHLVITMRSPWKQAMVRTHPTPSAHHIHAPHRDTR